LSFKRAPFTVAEKDGLIITQAAFVWKKNGIAGALKWYRFQMN
jgi:hypothetical protein